MENPISETICASVEVGDVKHISYRSLDLALSLFADSRQLPDSTLERIGIEDEEVAFFYSLVKRARSFADEVGDVSEVLISIVGDTPAALVSRGEEIWHSTVEQETTTLGVRVPAGLAAKLYDLLYSTVIYHRWPELWYTAGARPDEVSRAFLDLFGKEEPTFLEL
ncbi:hypothetical protein HRK28_08305 [Rathayibacter sp. VKM Ac-2835]|uniref:hypothetical protein n=1 Tax=Rathayibacter sp. VKM Ac-2835 TaxID=2739043 RepID=UPI00156577D8|nr:hypothetical protein [Rathayibacter sp. VKM Ac-2835]NRG40925.1 hypothetical protein [Rathayibacter sp. VKM Ac-2835]